MRVAVTRSEIGRSHMILIPSLDVPSLEPLGPDQRREEVDEQERGYRSSKVEHREFPLRSAHTRPGMRGRGPCLPGRAGTSLEARLQDSSVLQFRPKSLRMNRATGWDPQRARVPGAKVLRHFNLPQAYRAPCNGARASTAARVRSPHF